MRKLLIIPLLFLTSLAISQDKAKGDASLQAGIAHYNGLTAEYDPYKAKELFLVAAKEGNAEAMYWLGKIYISGKIGRPRADSTLYWYKQAAFNGNGAACFKLGDIYKMNVGAYPDFKTAVQYFQMGVDVNDTSCISALGYMSFKGLGTKQDYTKAFDLFSTAAHQADNKRAMYFLGTCYRNGYGTPADTTKANYWLKKAASLGEQQAFTELDEEMPENISTITNELQQQAELLKKNPENFLASEENNYEGKYTGYAIYYDWSGQYVTHIDSLILTLQKDGRQYRGTWQEGNNKMVDIDLSVNRNIFKFGRNNKYSRLSRYDGRTPAVWEFREAALKMSFAGDGIGLSGFVQFYSPFRKEPGKPLQILLKKKIEYSEGNLVIDDASVYPNPAANSINTQFSISHSAKISITVISQQGVKVFQEAEKNLPSGRYSYTIPISRLTAGSYIIQISTNGNQAKSIPFIKM